MQPKQVGSYGNSRAMNSAAASLRRTGTGQQVLVAKKSR